MPPSRGGGRYDGGVNDATRGQGEHLVALTSCGLTCRATRSNRDVLLAITGIIASKNHFRATSEYGDHITP